MIGRMGTAFLAVVVVAAVSGAAREIRIPQEAVLHGNVLIAEAFSRVDGKESIPLEFPAWPGEDGMRPATWFEVRIEAHPGDVIVLAPGIHEAQVWLFTSNLTVRTDPASAELAVVRGTMEIDADGVLLERIRVTSSSVLGTSGHGIEVNRNLVRSVTIRDCTSSENRWTGIHIIGVRGTIAVMRIEGCFLQGNGMDGMDAVSIDQLIVTGCTITGNGTGLATGVGIRINRFVGDVRLSANTVEDNRYADVYYSTAP